MRGVIVLASWLRLWPHSTMRALIFLPLVLFLSACQTAPVDRPCGVIRDDLRTVQGKTPADQQRIDIHFARGKAAGCW